MTKETTGPGRTYWALRDGAGLYRTERGETGPEWTVGVLDCYERGRSWATGCMRCCNVDEGTGYLKALLGQLLSLFGVLLVPGMKRYCLSEVSISRGSGGAPAAACSFRGMLR